MQHTEGAADIVQETRIECGADHLLRHQRIRGGDQFDGEDLVGLVVVIIFGNPRPKHRECRIVDRKPENCGFGPHGRRVRLIHVGRLLDDVTWRARALDAHQMIASDIFRRGDALRDNVVGREQAQAKQMLQSVAACQHDGGPTMGLGAAPGNSRFKPGFLRSSGARTLEIPLL